MAIDYSGQAAMPIVRRVGCVVLAVGIVAVAVMYAPEASDDQGNYSNQADIPFRKIGSVVAPNDAPPMPAGR
jgi:hypothetical protein